MPKAEELKYTKTHEWLHIAGSEGTIGLSEHAQKEMGDIVFVELPKPGRKLEKDKPCAVVESVKSAFDIYSPLNGEVVAVNEAVSGDPALINQSPLEGGWLFKVKADNPAEADGLMNFAAYGDFLKQNAH